jgi:hypothetical protein
MVFIGEKEELLDAVMDHAVLIHGHKDTPEHREELATALEPASAYKP